MPICQHMCYISAWSRPIGWQIAKEGEISMSTCGDHITVKTWITNLLHAICLQAKAVVPI